MKLTKQRLKEIIKEELDLSYEEELGATEPRFEAGNPEEKIINQLLIRAKVEGAQSAEEAADWMELGDDQEVINYLGSLMGDPMLAPNMEEAADTQLSRQRIDTTYRAASAKDSPRKSSKEARGREHKARRQYGKKLAQQDEIEEGWGWRTDDTPEPEETPAQKAARVRKQFQQQQSRKRSLARHKKARGLKSKAGI